MKNDRLVLLRGTSRSQKMFAEEIGVPTSTYAMIETGKRFPRRKLQAKLANYHGVTVDYLFFEDQNQNEHLLEEEN